jgi:hypothetical protein
MSLARVAVWLSLAAFLCTAQPDAASRIALLARVHAKMGNAMARFPNYTCNESITRWSSSGTPLRCEYMDRLRLEVAVVGGRELFSWPGAAGFERADPFEIVGSGPTGTGDFANFTKAVFVSDAPFYTYGAEELRAGRPAVRYDYRISRAKSGYTLRSGIGHALVGYHGSFWVDPAIEQVLALEVHADEIPETLDMSGVKTLIEYKLVRLDDEEFPFPDTSELIIQHRQSTVVSRNRIEFSECRRYTAEFTLR